MSRTDREDSSYAPLEENAGATATSVTPVPTQVDEGPPPGFTKRLEQEGSQQVLIIQRRWLFSDRKLWFVLLVLTCLIAFLVREFWTIRMATNDANGEGGEDDNGFLLLYIILAILLELAIIFNVTTIRATRGCLKSQTRPFSLQRDLEQDTSRMAYKNHDDYVTQELYNFYVSTGTVAINSQGAALT